MTALGKTGVATNGAYGKKEYKNITEEIKPKLKEVAKEKNLKIEDIVFIKKYNEEYVLNIQAREELLKKNLIKRPKNGECYFIKGNIVWIAQIKETGHYLYCSKNNATGEMFCLDIIDIFHILSNKPYGETQTNLIKTFGISTKEEEIKLNFRRSYLSNIEIIENVDSWSNKYPNLYNRAKSTLETYAILNTIALNNLIGIEGYTHDMAIFFASAKYISKLNEKSESVTRAYLNMLTLLGLIIKVKEESIPCSMRNRAKLEAKKRNLPTIINFFAIPKITLELLKKADNIALKARKNKLSLNNVGYKKIEEVFGKEMLTIVYGSESRAKEVKRAMDFKNSGESDISWEEIKGRTINKEKKIEVEFKVDNIIKRCKNTNYTIASITILKHPDNISVPTTNPIVEGYFPTINKNDNFKAIGFWKDVGKFGWQFEANLILLTLPESSKGFIEFLYKNTKGVGKITANKIVEKFGEDSFRVIKNSPEKLVEIEGIGFKKALKIHEELKKHTDYEEVYFMLKSLGFNSLEIAKIYDKCGRNVISKIKRDPYIVSRDKLASFKRADLIAEKLEIPANDQRRIREGVIQYINYNHKNKGNLFVYKDDLISELSKYLDDCGAYSKETIFSMCEIEEAIDNLIKDEIIATEKDKNNNICIYSKFYLDIENNIVKLLEKIIKNNSIETTSSIEIKEFLEENNMVASKWQKQAAIMALTNKLSILSGGPGTGKTTTAKLVVETIRNFNHNAKIELAAPTGRAARRLSKSTGLEAKTIHKLIGLNELEEKTQSLKEVDADFLIIDEASMIDAYLFYSLLSAINNNTQVLMIGDYNQLPSIGPGLVLRDLIKSKIIPCVILEEVYRQENGSKILENANKIVRGKKDLSLKTTNDFQFIYTQNKKEIQDNIIKSIENLLRLGYKMQDIQVITPMNKGDIGVLELNKIIEDKFNPKKAYEPEISIGDKVFRIGDKVMQTVNNYDLNVVNGETGRIIKIVDDSSIKKIVVDFRDKIVIYTDDVISQLTLAYAITVHKAQGNEFKVVIMPIHRSQSIMLNRNLVYTVWTRPKEKLICIGDREELYKSIDKTDMIERNSRLKEKVIKIGRELIDIPF